MHRVTLNDILLKKEKKSEKAVEFGNLSLSFNLYK